MAELRMRNLTEGELASARDAAERAVQDERTRQAARHCDKCGANVRRFDRGGEELMLDAGSRIGAFELKDRRAFTWDGFDSSPPTPIAINQGDAIYMEHHCSDGKRS
jgi:hypothetical protein